MWLPRGATDREVLAALGAGSGREGVSVLTLDDAEDVPHGFRIQLSVDAAPFALLNDSAAVMSTLRSAADAGGLTVVSEQLHEFPVMGGVAQELFARSGPLEV